MADRLLIDLDASGRASVSVSIDGDLSSTIGGAFEVSWPMADADLDDLRWYLEDYLRVPFGVYEDRGSAVADLLPQWGTRLFAALFEEPAGRDAYVLLRTRAAWPGRTEIVLRSAAPAWLGLPWELLRDPSLPTPLALDGIAISRSLPAAELETALEVEGERLRVLMVISRPAGTDDVGYRIIARPLSERLAGVPGRVDMRVLRPPTLDALAAALGAAREAGTPFHVVHFDGHGVFTGGRAGLATPSDVGRAGEGMLVFERPGGGADPVPAERVARVLGEARVPVVVLNACNSGAVGKRLEATVATTLLAGGTSAVVAMAYSVYAVAAAEFTTAFYGRLFAGKPVGDAVRAGREQLVRRPGRPSPKGELPLADWVVPVHYQRRDVRFPQLRSRRRPEGAADGARARERPREGGVHDDDLASFGRFVGRDDLFYDLEVAARGRRVVVLHGPAGTGKTELAKAFGRWWRDTGGVDRPERVVWHSFEPGVASFGLDSLVGGIGLRVFGAVFSGQEKQKRREQVERLLGEQRLLLILDNFESVCSMPDQASGTPPLDEAGRIELKRFLTDVAARGRSAVLVTSRSPEAWLDDACRIQVRGLARHEAVEYADHLLASLPAAAERRADPAFGRLLEWLDGNPLTMRLILPHLDTTEAGPLLAGLQGTRPLPEIPEGEQAASLTASMSYSVTHLSSADRRLLVAVSLFQGVAVADILRIFSESEEIRDRFGGVDVASWIAVLDRATQTGLLTSLGLGLYIVHPALPAYLVGLWRVEDGESYASWRDAAERAMLNGHAGLAVRTSEEIERGDASTAYGLMGLLRRTFGHQLDYALDSGLWMPALAITRALGAYWKRSGLVQEAEAWGERILRTVEAAEGGRPPRDEWARALWLLVQGDKGARLNTAGRGGAAAEIYEDILRMDGEEPSEDRQEARGITYHQLGVAALVRGDWADARRLFQQSLAVWERLGQREGKARSYHQLGRVAQELGELDEAERYHHRSLALSEELDNQSEVAASCHELGFIAQEKGNRDDAEQWYHRALAIKESLGDRPAMTTSCLQLGSLAQIRHSGAEAEYWYHRALAIQEELGDQRGIATSYHQLGTLAQQRGDGDAAEQWYRKAIAILETLEERPRLAAAYGQRGMLALQRGRTSEALEWLVRSVALFDDFPHPAIRPLLPPLTALIKLKGVSAFQECWRRVTGSPPPVQVRKFAESAGGLHG